MHLSEPHSKGYVKMLIKMLSEPYQHSVRRCHPFRWLVFYMAIAAVSSVCRATLPPKEAVMPTEGRQAWLTKGFTNAEEQEYLLYITVDPLNKGGNAARQAT